jgi:hypothetical protein
MDIEYVFSRGTRINEIGSWLDNNMPNRPLPDLQRWSIGYATDATRCGIRFADEYDATIFLLRWGGTDQ